MAKDNSIDIGSIIALISGFIMLLYSIYYMQSLSYSVGLYSGITRTLNNYNITVTPQVIATLSQASALSLGLHLTYLLIVLALLFSAVALLWFFSKSYGRFSAEILIFCSLVYLIIVVVLEYNFNFASVTSSYGSFLGTVFGLISGIYLVIGPRNRSSTGKRAVSPISISSDTPYSNIKMISNKLMSKLNGEIKILDMHFDAVGMDNLMQLLDKNMQQYTRISVLAKGDRLGDKFTKNYKDFKTELENRNVAFELRILSEKEAQKQHERIIMDDNTAYKIPPLNIINKKNEHIVSIKHEYAAKTFNDLWSEATKYENMSEKKQEPKNLQ